MSPQPRWVSWRRDSDSFEPLKSQKPKTKETTSIPLRKDFATWLSLPARCSIFISARCACMNAINSRRNVFLIVHYFSVTCFFVSLCFTQKIKSETKTKVFNTKNEKNVCIYWNVINCCKILKTVFVIKRRKVWLEWNFCHFIFCVKKHGVSFLYMYQPTIMQRRVWVDLSFCMTWQSKV